MGALGLCRWGEGSRVHRPGCCQARAFRPDAIPFRLFPESPAEGAFYSFKSQATIYCILVLTFYFVLGYRRLTGCDGFRWRAPEKDSVLRMQVRILPSRPPRNTEQGAVCCAEGPCWLLTQIWEVSKRKWTFWKRTTSSRECLMTLSFFSKS